MLCFSFPLLHFAEEFFELRSCGLCRFSERIDQFLSFQTQFHNQTWSQLSLDSILSKSFWNTLSIHMVFLPLILKTLSMWTLSNHQLSPECITCHFYFELSRVYINPCAAALILLMRSLASLTWKTFWSIFLLHTLHRFYFHKISALANQVPCP